MEETIRVEVTYLFPCNIPLVSLVLCVPADAARRAVPEMAAAQDPSGAIPGRVYVLRGHAELPNQGAKYRYRGAGSGWL